MFSIFSQIGETRPQYVYHNGHQQQPFGPSHSGSMPRSQPHAQQHNNNKLQGGLFQPNLDQIYQQKEGSPTADSGIGSETKISLTKVQGRKNFEIKEWHFDPITDATTHHGLIDLNEKVINPPNFKVDIPNN